MNNQLRREKLDLETQIVDLKNRLDASQRVVAGLRGATASTQPTLPADRLAKLYTTTGITLGRLTGGVDLDREKSGDEALRVYVAPTDESADALKAAGSFTIEAFDLEDAAAPLLGSWTLTVEEARANWRSSLLEYTYAFNFPWQRVPTRGQITVKVKFVDELTQTAFTVQKVVTVKPPAAGATSQPATGPATQRTVDAGPGSRVFADPGDAKRIVYVFDTSIRMMQKALDPVEQLFAAIKRLGPDQSFGVVRFADGESATAFSNALMAATPENKHAAYFFIQDGTLRGESDSRAALRAAFAMKPDLVYLFSAADRSHDEVADLVATLNADHTAAVHAILYDVYSGHAEPRAGMRRIAADNRGTFRDWNQSESLPAAQ